MTLIMVMIVIVTMTLIMVMIVIVAVALIVVMLMIVTVALIVVMVMMSMLLFEILKSTFESILFLHCGQYILAVKLVPRSGYDRSVSIMLSDKLNSGKNLLLLSNVRMGKNNRRCIGNLIVVELAKVLHIHLTLIYVCYSGKAIQLSLRINRLNRFYNVRELSNSAGLNDNSVRIELIKNLDKSLGKITYKGATYAAGIHLRDLDAGILEKSSIYTDLAKFIFDKHKLLTRVCFLDQFFYKCCFTGTKKSGKNIYFSHFQLIARRQTSANSNILLLYIFSLKMSSNTPHFQAKNIFFRQVSPLKPFCRNTS